MTGTDGFDLQNRNKNFEETHRLLIEKATEIFAERGSDGVSMAALARATGINRSTVYYHFENREALLAATEEWVARRQTKELDAHVSCWASIDQISGFVQRNPDIIRGWIDDYIEVGDLRQRYPLWDDLVARIAHAFDEMAPGEPLDTAVDCAVMLTSALILPRLLPHAEHAAARLE
jgi:AcrR family transcriptional regulator